MTSLTRYVPSSAINSGCNTLTPVSIITASTPLPVKENMVSLSTFVVVVIPTPWKGELNCPPFTNIWLQFDLIEFVWDVVSLSKAAVYLGLLNATSFLNFNENKDSGCGYFSGFNSTFSTLEWVFKISASALLILYIELLNENILSFVHSIFRFGMPSISFSFII